MPSQDRSTGRLLEALASVFGVDEAAYFIAQLRAAESSHESVTLDLHAVREIHDDALASVARELERCHGAVIGLSEHHARVLRYLGLNVPLGHPH